MILGIDASRANHEQKTGVESYAFSIIEELKKITDPQVVHVVLYTDIPLQGQLAELPTHWSQKVLRWPPRRLWTQLRLSWEMLVHPPDVLFIPAHVPPLIHPAKTVMTVHDVAALRFPQSYNWFERWYTLWSARYAVKRLHKIIVPSEFTKRELHAYVPCAYKDKISVVSHGYNSQFNVKGIEKTEDVLQKYGVREPFLLSIGRLEEKKNTKRIVQAFDILKSQYASDPVVSSLQLLLVGKPGHGYADVERMIQASRYKKDIITPGWVDDVDMASILRLAEVFLFPSLYEGFGLPVLESFAAGVPVIASKGSSLEEVGDDAAVYTDPLSADKIAATIHRVLSEETLRKEMIQKGLERVRHFSWETCAQETLRTISR